MRKKIIAFRHYFNDFMASLPAAASEKVYYGLSILSTGERVASHYVKFIRDGLFELRVTYNKNCYRIFFIYDEGNIVVLFQGFQKKTQKTPPKEIEKALKLKQEYYASK